ncbi:MAG TPA: hypothetical protein VGZ26_11185 [Pirellulales bacterium]|nr:hypothetical protein [Pirellulales bacterium]
MEQPAVEPRGAGPVVAAGQDLYEVRSDAMAEMLEEQERADRDRLRGLRRRFRNPPSMEEMVSFLTEHKLFVTVAVLSVFFVVEFLREREIVLALVFGAAGLGLSVVGLKPRLADGVLYQASAWCYLVVLCAFPILLANKDALGLAGTNALRNPTMVAATPSVADPLSASAPPTPASSPEPASSVDEDVAATIEIDRVSGKTDKQVSLPAAPESPSATNPPESSQAVPGNPAFSNPEDQPPIVTGSHRNMTEQTSETFRQMADRAFSESDARKAFRYLHADALTDDDSDVWRFVRWNRGLNRPAIGIRWGVGVDYNNLAIQLLAIQVGQHQGAMTIDAQKHLAVAFHKQTIPAGTTLSLGMLVSNRLCDCHDQGLFGDSELILAPTERSLRGATYLGADTPAELLRAARTRELDFLFVFDVRATAGAATQPKFSTGIRIVDVARGADIYPSPKQKPLALRKDVEAALDYLEKELGLGEIPASIDPVALKAHLKAATSRKPENPLALLTELRWCQREKKLPVAEVEKSMSNLVGGADAGVLAQGSDVERAKLVLKWLPAHN